MDARKDDVKSVTGGEDENSVRIDTEVLAWFKTHGADYERHINAVLRKYVALHRQDVERGRDDNQE